MSMLHLGSWVFSVLILSLTYAIPQTQTEDSLICGDLDCSHTFYTGELIGDLPDFHLEAGARLDVLAVSRKYDLYRTYMPIEGGHIRYINVPKTFLKFEDFDGKHYQVNKPLDQVFSVFDKLRPNQHTLSPQQRTTQQDNRQQPLITPSSHEESPRQTNVAPTESQSVAANQEVPGKRLPTPPPTNVPQDSGQNSHPPRQENFAPTEPQSVSANYEVPGELLPTPLPTNIPQDSVQNSHPPRQENFAPTEPQSVSANQEVPGKRLPTPPPTNIPQDSVQNSHPPRQENVASTEPQSVSANQEVPGNRLPTPPPTNIPQDSVQNSHPPRQGNVAPNEPQSVSGNQEVPGKRLPTPPPTNTPQDSVQNSHPPQHENIAPSEPQSVSANQEVPSKPAEPSAGSNRPNQSPQSPIQSQIEDISAVPSPSGTSLDATRNADIPEMQTPEQHHLDESQQVPSVPIQEDAVPPQHVGLPSVEQIDELSEDLIFEEPPPPFIPQNITAVSSFFRCLSHAADGGIPAPELASYQDKSSFAAVVVKGAQYYFHATQLLLTKIPPSVTHSLDSALVVVFGVSLNLLVSWMLFVFSFSLTFFITNIVGFCLLRSCAADSSDASQRSLEEWVAIEDNADMVAAKLADKEDEYARLNIWAAKVNERFEKHVRGHSITEGRAQTLLRETKTTLEECRLENKELQDTHDAIVQELAKVKQESASVASQLRQEITSLNAQLESCVRQCKATVEAREKTHAEILDAVREERDGLIEQVHNYKTRLSQLEETSSTLAEQSQKLEVDRVERDRELEGLRNAFIVLKTADLKRQQRCEPSGSQKTPVDTEDGETTDGWDVDELDLHEEDEESGDGGRGKSSNFEVESALQEFLSAARLRAELTTAGEQLRAEMARREQETHLRLQLEEKVAATEEQKLDLCQSLSQAHEDRDAAIKKLEVLSDYFKEREVVFQRDLGRQAVTETESNDELLYLRQKERNHEVEIKNLREQVALARRELADAERINRRQISELDKRLHENWLSAKASENLVKEIRDENATLRQKMASGDRMILRQLTSGGRQVPPPPPPPPPPAFANAFKASTEMRSHSRQSACGAGAGPDGASFMPPPFLPPPPPGMFPLGLMPPFHLLPPNSSGRHSAVGGQRKSGSSPSGSQHSAR